MITVAILLGILALLAAPAALRESVPAAAVDATHGGREVLVRDERRVCDHH